MGEPAGDRHRPDPPAAAAPRIAAGDGAGAAAGTRRRCASTRAGFATAPIYWRPDLPAGDVVAGPAVIEEFGSTVPCIPGSRATVDRLGNLRA